MGKRLSREQWAVIQRRYVDGREPAKGLAREFGITAGAIYKRSVQGNWIASSDAPDLKPSDGIASVVSRLERIADRFEAALAAGEAR